MGQIMGLFPHTTHVQAALTEIAIKYKMPGIWYMDLWPFGPVFVVIRDPTVGDQALVHKGLPQHVESAEFLEPFIGKDPIPVTNGLVWKKLHGGMAPGCAWPAVRRMTDLILEEAAIFRDALARLSDSGEVFSMEALGARLIFDVVGRAVFNARLNAQTTDDSLVRDLQAIVDLTTAQMDAANKFNPVKRFKMWQEKRQILPRIDRPIRRKIQERLESWLDSDEVPSKARPDSILDSMLRAYLEDDRKGDQTLKINRRLPDDEMLLLATK